MATVKFRLNRPKEKDGQLKKVEVPVLVEFYNQGLRVEVSTGEKVIPKHWNKEKQEVKATMTGHTEVNLHLSEIKNSLVQLWRDNKGLTSEELKTSVLKFVKGEHHSEKKNVAPLAEYITDFISKCVTGLVNRASGTVQTYESFLDHLQAFSKETRTPLTFEAVTMEFYNSFMAYLYRQGQNDNTAGKQIKILKMFMAASLEEGLHANVDFKKKKFRKLTAETDEVYLTQDEILKIYSLDLSDRPALAKYRDLFVFNCWVGIRFGDLCNIQPEQIQQHLHGKLLKLTTEKTNEQVIIPFHPIAEAIYSIHDHQLPRLKKTDNVPYNEALKTICKDAGINSKQQSRTFIKGKANIEYFEKWEMVSAHTARRSFATNCYLMGIPTRSIMAITGHKTEKAFNKYIRITKDEHAQIMLQHFNSNPLMVMRKAL